MEDIATRYIEGDARIDQVMVGVDAQEDQKDNQAGQSRNQITSIHGIGTEDTSLREGSVSYDLRFLAMLLDSAEQIHLIINLEVQNQFHPGYPLIKRGIYYGGRMLSAQYGTEFTGSHYERLKKSIFYLAVYEPA